MSADLFLRTVGTLLSIYAIGTLVTVMSLTAVETAGLNLSGPTCDPSECRVIARQEAPSYPSDNQPDLISAAALMASGF